MSLSLAEVKSLIGALGIVVPDALLNQKARAEEFATRREQVTVQGKEKPQTWRLKSKFDELMTAAAGAAGQRSFDLTFNQLEEAEQLLQQPEAPPVPPPPPPPVPAPAEPAATLEPAAQPAVEPEATEKEAPAGHDDTDATVSSEGSLLEVWLAAKDRVDEQISRLQSLLRQTKNPLCERIAEMGLNGVTGNLQVSLQVALTECVRVGGRDPKRTAAASSIVSQFQQFLQNNKAVELCDENPFGIKCNIRGTLLEALSELDRNLKN